MRVLSICALAVLAPSSAVAQPVIGPVEEIWRFETGDLPGSFDASKSRDVALDASGDVIAVGDVVSADADDDFAIVKLEAQTGVEIWSVRIDGSSSGGESGRAVALDGSGDVLAAGYVENGPNGDDFAVFKLSGEDGAEVWSFVINGSGDENESARDVTVDANGDVVAAGEVVNGVTGEDFAVYKLSGETGGEVWRFVLDGSSGPLEAHDRAKAVALDGDGDAIAVGRVQNAGTGRDLAVFKVSGSTGAEAWRRFVDGTNGEDDTANAVAVDGDGNVLVAGKLDNGGDAGDFFVLKLSGANGEVVWRREVESLDFAGGEAAAITVDGEGDVVAVGGLSNESASVLAVVKLSGVSGEELWRFQRPDSGGGMSVANDVSLDAHGDVIAVGQIQNSGSFFDFAAFKLSGESGELIWQIELDGVIGLTDAALAVAMDASGRPIVAGELANSAVSADFAVVKLPEPSPALQCLSAAVALLALGRLHRVRTSIRSH